MKNDSIPSDVIFTTFKNQLFTGNSPIPVKISVSPKIHKFPNTRLVFHAFVLCVNTVLNRAYRRYSIDLHNWNWYAYNSKMLLRNI